MAPDRPPVLVQTWEGALGPRVPPSSPRPDLWLPHHSQLPKSSVAPTSPVIHSRDLSQRGALHMGRRTPGWLTAASTRGLSSVVIPD